MLPTRDPSTFRLVCKIIPFPTPPTKRMCRLVWKTHHPATITHDRGRYVLYGTITALIVHHIKPRCLGRNDRLGNLVTLCEMHHRMLEGLGWIVVRWVGSVLVRVVRLMRGCGRPTAARA